MQWGPESNITRAHFYIPNTETYCKSDAALEYPLRAEALVLANVVATIKLSDSLLYLHTTASAPSAAYVVPKHNDNSSGTDNEAYAKGLGDSYTTNSNVSTATIFES
jgi:hypothetical protein